MVPNLKIQQWLDNQWMDYTPFNDTDTIRITNSDEGLAEYEQLLPGKYRAVEVEAAPGYDIKSAKFEPSDEFEIHENDESGIVITVTNRKNMTAPAPDKNEPDATPGSRDKTELTDNRQTPKTGDQLNLGFILIGVICSAVIFIFLYIQKKRRFRQQK